MRVDLDNGKTAWLIGDPHIGRKFEVGVPLHRRGDREKRQLNLLRAELAQPCDYNVCVGDVFDHPHVPHKVVCAAADVYVQAARLCPKTTFIIIAGNHDIARNRSVIGAFDALERMLEGVNNIDILRRPKVIGGIALMPWEWELSAAEQTLFLNPEGVQIVVGHFDLQSFGGDDSHIAPTRMLKARYPAAEIFSGHYHIAGDYTVDGVTVRCVGSMEPYSHAEDPDGDLYVTLTLDELEDNRDIVADKCVRLVLEPGQEAPADLDCYALTVKQAALASEDREVVSVGDFDWKSLMDEALEPLTEPVREFIKERL